jgi:hypothetical protein
MLKNTMILFLLMTMTDAFSIDGQLDGKTFCRSVKVAGFGRPPGKALHCLKFKGGRLTDNRNTLFGNPPETFTYDIVKKEIINVDDSKITEYVIKNEKTILNKAGQAFRRK